MKKLERLIIDGFEFAYIEGMICVGGTFDYTKREQIEAFKHALILNNTFQRFRKNIEAGRNYKLKLDLLNLREILNIVAGFKARFERGNFILPTDYLTMFFAFEMYLEDRLTNNPTRGYVYLLQHDGTDDIYKIGCSKSPQDRLFTFEVKLPFQVHYIHLLETEDMRGTEAQLHYIFQHRRLNGEWFRLTEFDVAFFKAYCP